MTVNDRLIEAKELVDALDRGCALVCNQKVYDALMISGLPECLLCKFRSAQKQFSEIVEDGVIYAIDMDALFKRFATSVYGKSPKQDERR